MANSRRTSAAARRQINFSIVIEKQRWIDPALIKFDWIGPFARRVFRENEKIAVAFGLERRDHVEHTVVITNRRRPDAAVARQSH